MAASVGTFLILLLVALAIYAAVVYPLALLVIAIGRRPDAIEPPSEWPRIDILLVCHNGESSLAATLDSVLAANYAAERRRILVVSDGSTDGTVGVVAGYANRGVELLELPTRVGKAAAENAAWPCLTGEIVVLMDNGVRLAPNAVSALVRTFGDPAVGVASGCDAMPGGLGSEGTGESHYVVYEMWVRSLESLVDSIVGASGCFYAVRRDLFSGRPIDPRVHRDFAAVLLNRASHRRAVLAKDAVCEVQPAPAIGVEFERKARTMSMGLFTLWRYRHLLNPARFGAFAFMLFSHKLCRWLLPPAALTALLGSLLVSQQSEFAAAAIVGATLASLLALLWHLRPTAAPRPALLHFPLYVFAAVGSGIVAWKRVLFGSLQPYWNPTPRNLGQVPGLVIDNSLLVGVSANLPRSESPMEYRSATADDVRHGCRLGRSIEPAEEAPGWGPQAGT